MDTKGVLQKVEDFLTDKMTAEIDALNALYPAAEPLRTDLSYFQGFYDPLNLAAYPGVIIAADKVAPADDFPVYQVDIVVAFKSDDQKVLNDLGPRYGDALANAVLNNHRIHEDFHISEIESLDHAGGTGLYLVDLLLRIETTR